MKRYLPGILRPLVSEMARKEPWIPGQSFRFQAILRALVVRSRAQNNPQFHLWFDLQPKPEGSIGTARKKLRTKTHKFPFFKVKPLNVYEVWIAHLIEPNAPFTPNQ